MIYLIGILISLASGFLIIRLLGSGRLNLILHILLALVLGLGIDGTVGFYTHILLNQFNHWMPVGIVVLGIAFLSLKTVIRNDSLLKNNLRHKASLKNAPRNDTGRAVA